MRPFTKYLLLATVNGVLSFLVLATVERINLHYANLQFRLDMERGVFGYLIEQPRPFWNLPTFLFHLALFLVATLVVRRYFPKVLASDFFFWLVVGVVVAVTWALTLSIGITADALATGHSPLEMILQAIIFRSSQRIGLISLTLVLGVNALFGAVVQIVTMHYWHRTPRYS